MLDYCEHCEIYKPCDCSGPEDEPQPAFYCVSIYHVDRAYGGHEEGGWYYDCGTPAHEYGWHTVIFTSEVDAYAYREHLEDKVLPELNEGRPSISSVLSQGEYRAIVDEGSYPQPFPQRRPHYE